MNVDTTISKSFRITWNTSKGIQIDEHVCIKVNQNTSKSIESKSNDWKSFNSNWINENLSTLMKMPKSIENNDSQAKSAKMK